MTEEGYETITSKLKKGLDDADRAEANALALASNASALFAHLLDQEELAAVMFLSGVRWEQKRKESSGGVI